MTLKERQIMALICSPSPINTLRHSVMEISFLQHVYALVGLMLDNNCLVCMLHNSRDSTKWSKSHQNQPSKCNQWEDVFFFLYKKTMRKKGLYPILSANPSQIGAVHLVWNIECIKQVRNSSFEFINLIKLFIFGFSFIFRWQKSQQDGGTY